ncbi:hypothetical protein GJ654_12455 [Rhodoblastus acidophilus]|uniref:Uncharacterized protein n=1 Tax=Rhodoblastus acidophilus TaxID=1074 RepID=A0A6N8DN06_RHOAC|nr:hypothetical protein [Rhodoblastus acidophilus]MCW2275310.1 hypothetical protein [Rhodoblastus acidophilus]MTV31797.1 hypothetical protein [Rhodoblastus acidophilus]
MDEVFVGFPNWRTPEKVKKMNDYRDEEEAASPRQSRKSKHYPFDWPEIGPVDLQIGPSNIFLTDEYKDVARDSDRERRIYFGATTGLARVLAIPLGMPIYKASTCPPDGLERRMLQLNADAHAAVAREGDNWRKDPGFTRWFPSHIFPMQRLSECSPVRVEPRGLVVRLPKEMEPEEFDARFDAQMRSGAIDLWAMTPEGSAHCAAVGVARDAVLRHTEYPGWKRMPATELVAFSIYSGADRALCIVESIIAAHYGLKRKPI